MLRNRFFCVLNYDTPKESSNLSDTMANVTTSAEGLSTSKSIVLVVIIFVSSLLALGLLYTQFPDLEE